MQEANTQNYVTSKNAYRQNGGKLYTENDLGPARELPEENEFKETQQVDEETKFTSEVPVYKHPNIMWED